MAFYTFFKRNIYCFFFILQPIESVKTMTSSAKRIPGMYAYRKRKNAMVTTIVETSGTKSRVLLMSGSRVIWTNIAAKMVKDVLSCRSNAITEMTAETTATKKAAVRGFNFKSFFLFFFFSKKLTNVILHFRFPRLSRWPISMLKCSVHSEFFSL